MGKSWGRVFEIKENFHKGFELVAPLANKFMARNSLQPTR
jgi:hypothetical protein